MNQESYFLSLYAGRTFRYSHRSVDLTNLHLQTHSVKHHLSVRNISPLIIPGEILRKIDPEKIQYKNLLI